MTISVSCSVHSLSFSILHCSQGVTIGDDAVIGIRSVVTNDIKPGTLIVGSPSKEIQSGID